MASKTAPWLGRFEPPLLLRSQGAFRVVTTRELASGTRRLVVHGAPGRDPRAVRRCLAALARAHQRLDHPRIAPVADHDEHGSTPFVSFACDAELDLGALLQASRKANLRVPHAQADGFIRGLREALQAAHRVPSHLGSLGYANVVFNRAGQHWLLGFGHNVVTFDEEGTPVVGEPTFQAPELSLGERPSASGDFVALLLMMRSMVSVVSLAPAVARVVLGRSLREDLELVRNLLWFERRVVAALPGQRVSIEEAIAVSDRIRQLLGVTPDPDGFERLAGSLASRLLPETASRTLRLGPESVWMDAPDGTHHTLGTRTALRRILLALAVHHRDAPGSALSLNALIEAGWPGEQPRGETGANRTYVLLSELRRMGLRDVLQRHGQGYRLDPSLRVSIEPS